jgi:Ca-activated chloride channel family protein
VNRRYLLAIAALALLFPVSGFAADTGTVQFLSPVARRIVLGVKPIEVVVKPADGLTVRQVEFRVDEQTIQTLTRPPWKVSFDFGPEGKNSRVRALVTFSDGSVIREYSSTRALVINDTALVDLVNLYILARRGDGSYVGDLARQDFQILEDGVPQKVLQFGTERKPLTVAIVMDVSRSMKKGDRIGASKSAALAFLKALDPRDEVLLVTFSDKAVVTQPLTDNHENVATKIREMQPERGTALYDGIYLAARKLDQVPGRKVMVLLTDGRDEAISGVEPGSLHTLDEAIGRALRSEVMVFSIGLGKDVQHWKDFYEREYLIDILARIADRTGGRMLLPSRAGQLRNAFEDVEEDLRNQYSIAYRSTNRAQDGRWRTIEVRTPGKELQLITRDGYYSAVEMQSESGGPVAPVEDGAP